jgi:hypothetical protein
MGRGREEVGSSWGGLRTLYAGKVWRPDRAKGVRFRGVMSERRRTEGRSSEGEPLIEKRQRGVFPECGFGQWPARVSGDGQWPQWGSEREGGRWGCQWGIAEGGRNRGAGHAWFPHLSVKENEEAAPRRGLKNGVEPPHSQWIRGF